MRFFILETCLNRILFKYNADLLPLKYSLLIFIDEISQLLSVDEVTVFHFLPLFSILFHTCVFLSLFPFLFYDHFRNFCSCTGSSFVSLVIPTFSNVIICCTWMEFESTLKYPTSRIKLYLDFFFCFEDRCIKLLLLGADVDLLSTAAVPCPAVDDPCTKHIIMDSFTSLDFINTDSPINSIQTELQVYNSSLTRFLVKILH